MFVLLVKIFSSFSNQLYSPVFEEHKLNSVGFISTKEWYIVPVNYSKWLISVINIL